MNLIHELITNAGDNLEVRTNAKFVINALTAQVISSMMSHVATRAQRPDETDDNIGVPSLDVRNEQDEATRGQELRNQMTDELGFDAPVPAYYIADVCDSIRYGVYEELARVLGPDTPLAEDVLVREAKGLPQSYDLPMSARSMYAFRIQKAGEVSPEEVKLQARENEEDEEFTRQTMAETAQRDVKKLIQMQPDVFNEIESLNGVYDFDAFTSLPMDTQQRIAAKVLASLTRENKRLYSLVIKQVATVKVSGDPVPVVTLRKFVKASIAKCEAFLNEAAGISV